MTTALEQRSEGNAGLAAAAGQASIQFQDEGSNLGTSGTATTVNFTGAGVTASRATNTVTVNVPVSGEAFPVGSIFFAAVSTNPATLLGYGTWSAIGAGRVLVGQDTGDTDFDVLGETGGAKTSSHTHPAGTLTTDTFAAHTHGYGTIATVAESSHTHGGGSLATNTQGAHQHQSFSLTTDTYAAHTHPVGTLAVTDPATGATYHTRRHDHEMFEVYKHSHIIAAGQGSHQHGMAEGTTDGSGTYMDRSNAAAATTAQTDLATLPQMVTNDTGSLTARTGEARENGSTTVAWDTAHSVSGSTGTGGGHSHAVNSGYTTLEGDHTHFSFTGSTGAGSSHSHGVSGSTASDGAHGHNVNAGSTGSTASSTVQPYLVVAMWQRVS